MEKKVLMSAFADEFDQTLDIQLEELNRLGIGYIEPRGADGKDVSAVDEKTAKEMRRKLDSAGIKVSSIASPIGKVGIKTDFKVYSDFVKKAFENACILGAKNVRIFSFYLDNYKRDECREKVIENLNNILDIADKFSLTICHENEADIYGESPEECYDLVTALNSRLKTVFDMGNYVLGGYEPWSAYQLLKPHIEYFHIKDSLYTGEIVLPGVGDGKIVEILSDFYSISDKPFYATLEPHLSDFPGLASLTDVKLKFSEDSDCKTSFHNAAERFMRIVERINR